MLVPDGGYMKENNISSGASPSNSNAIPTIAQAPVGQGTTPLELEDTVDLLELLGPPVQGLCDYLIASADVAQNLRNLDKALTPQHSIWVRERISLLITLLEEQRLIEEIIIKTGDPIFIRVPLLQDNVTSLFHSLQMLLNDETIKKAIAEILVSLATAMAALDPNYINLPPANVLLYSLGVLLEEQNESTVKIAVAALNKLYATETLKQQPQRLALLIGELKYHLLPDNKNHSAIEAVAKTLRHLVSFLLMHLQSNRDEQSLARVHPIIYLWGVLLIHLEDKENYQELVKFPELYNLIINMTSINWVQAVIAILFNNPQVLASSPTATQGSMTKFQNELLTLILRNLKESSSPTRQDVCTISYGYVQTVAPPPSVTKGEITTFMEKLISIIGVVNLKLDGLLTDERVTGLLNGRRATEVLYGLSTIRMTRTADVVDAVIKSKNITRLVRAFGHKDNIMPILNFIKLQKLPVSELDFTGWNIKNPQKTLIRGTIIPLIRNTSLRRLTLIGEFSTQDMYSLLQTLRRRIEPLSLLVDNPQWTDKDRAEYQIQLKKAAVCNQSKAMLLGYTLSAVEQDSLRLYGYFKALKEDATRYCASAQEGEASYATNPLQEINSRLVAILSEVVELFKAENIYITRITNEAALLDARIALLQKALIPFQQGALKWSQQEAFKVLAQMLLEFLPLEMRKQVVAENARAGSLVALVQLLIPVSARIKRFEDLGPRRTEKRRKNTTSAWGHRYEFNGESAPVTVYTSGILNFVTQVANEARDRQAQCNAKGDDNGESSSCSDSQFFAP